MKTIRTAKESRLTYTANGIKGKNGEIISKFGELSYLAAYYDFDPVKLEICLTVKDYEELRIIPHGCNVRNNSDYMTDCYEHDKLKIPATAGAEFLAAAIGYKKHIEVLKRKGEKFDYYKREAEQADRNADALTLAEQIASGATYAGGWGSEKTLETVIAINIKTGEREQVTNVSLAEAYEFYKRVAA